MKALLVIDLSVYKVLVMLKQQNTTIVTLGNYSTHENFYKICQ
jgi:hypothetical protein